MRHAFALVIALVLGLAHAPSPASAQSQDFTHDGRIWTAFNFQGPIVGDLFFIGDLGWRMYLGDIAPMTPQQPIARGALAWRFFSQPELGTMYAALGYAWQPNWGRPGLVGFTDEHRTYAAFHWDYTHQETGIRLSFRFRVEARFRHPDQGLEVGVRFREQARLLVPLENSRVLFLVFWDELFENPHDSGHTAYTGVSMGMQTTLYTSTWQNAGFDQNRAFLGLGVQVIPSVFRVEAGYLNQWVRRPANTAGDAMNHVFMLQTYVNWS